MRKKIKSKAVMNKCLLPATKQVGIYIIQHLSAFVYTISTCIASIFLPFILHSPRNFSRLEAIYSWILDT